MSTIYTLAFVKLSHLIEGNEYDILVRRLDKHFAWGALDMALTNQERLRQVLGSQKYTPEEAKIVRKLRGILETLPPNLLIDLY